MKSARVIITTNCHRNCMYCCNRHEATKQNIQEIGDIFEVRGFDSVVLTGGEPTLDMGLLRACANAVRAMNPRANVYLQSARYAGWARQIFKLFDGVTFSLHNDVTSQELLDFEELQEKLFFEKPLNFSSRLVIMGRIHKIVPVIPAAWDRIKFEDIKEDGDCQAPEDTLFLLKS